MGMRQRDTLELETACALRWRCRLKHNDLPIATRESGDLSETLPHVAQMLCGSWGNSRGSLASSQSSYFSLLRVYGRGGGVARGLGVGADLGVGVGLAVDVAVAVAVAVGVPVGVAVAVAVAVGVALGEPVGVGVGVPQLCRM
jgi:hypothetical protein